MSQKRVLIVGGGIAGPVLAYWLGKHGYKIVVVERSPHHAQSGQIVDIEGPSQEILSRMGLLDQIHAAATHEKGMTIVDETNRIVGAFPAGQAGGMSKEIEIMRPRLAEVIFNAANSLETVEFRFGCTVSDLEKRGSDVRVEIQDLTTNDRHNEEYDIVVACDGLRSKTRTLILPDAQSIVKSLEIFIAFFDIPAEPQDYDYSRAHHMPGRKLAFIKPLNKETSSVSLGVIKYDQELHDARESRDLERQKQVLAGRFRGCGWETDRLVREMLQAKNFYFEEISQVRVDKWSDGRCVLLGDTAWCPSPLSGQGSNTAILGAYVLANSIINHGDNLEQAFEEYEREMRPYVNKIQHIPLGGSLPKIVSPDTAWGIWIQRTVVWLIASSGIYKYFPESKVDFDRLPELS